MCSRIVSLGNPTRALSCWKDTIAVGLWHEDIIIINAITGSQTAVFSGHTDLVTSLVFSSDGTSLVSGSDDGTVKLWDVQTGGVVKTFSGHSNTVCSVSISADSTMIASGSDDNTIHLWDIQTGECYHVIEQWNTVDQVCFSPTDPQCLLSNSDYKIWQWDINGHQIPPTYDGTCVAFSPDGTQFVLTNGAVVTVQNSNSRAIVAEFHVANDPALQCCFSPDGRLVAVTAGHTVYIWDITGSDPHPVKTLIGHSSITSIVFTSPSSLISISDDSKVTFWQIGVPSTDPVKIDPESIPITSAPIRSITLQPKDGVAISSDLDGIVRIWGISTGICRTSFQTPAKDYYHRDVRLINGRLIFVWCADKIHIWDSEQGEVLQIAYHTGGEFDDPFNILYDLRMSGDGSKIFLLNEEFIQTLSRLTGEILGRVEIEQETSWQSLTVDGSRVWIHNYKSEYQGWDFGTQGSTPVQLPNVPPNRLHLSDTMLWDPSLSRIKNTVTGGVAYQLSGRFANPTAVQCDGCYMAAGYNSGEVLILDFNHLPLQ